MNPKFATLLPPSHSFHWLCQGSDPKLAHLLIMLGRARPFHSGVRFSTFRWLLNQRGSLGLHQPFDCRHTRRKDLCSERTAVAQLQRTALLSPLDQRIFMSISHPSTHQGDGLETRSVQISEFYLDHQSFFPFSFSLLCSSRKIFAFFFVHMTISSLHA